MGSSNFLPFNPTATNQESDAAYLADSQRAGGYGVDNIVPSALLNKVQYQASIFCAAFGQMMAAKPGAYSLNDASQSALAAVLSNILTESDLGTNLVSVAYSPTPTFNATSTNGFQMALTGNITSSAITGVSIGQLVAFYFSQDSAGGRTIVWPASMVGTIQPDPAANAVSVMLFRADLSGNLRAASPMISNNGVFFGSRVASPFGLTAPTVSTNDNSINVATTAWVNQLMAGSIIGNGYIKLAGGLILQWGTGSEQGPGTRNVPVTFPITFPHQCFIVLPVGLWVTGQNSSLAQVEQGSITATGFQFGVANTGSVNGTTIPMWFAIGN